MKTASPLSYFGSDAKVANRIGGYFDSCSHVTIACVGGASILPHLGATRIVCNDTNEFAINFYECVAGLHGERTKLDLIDCCENTLSHPAHLKKAADRLTSVLAIDQAWAYWALCWLGRGGQGGTKKIADQKKTSFRMTPSGGSNASRLRSAAEDLTEWAKHFERCEFSCLDICELLPKVKFGNSNCGLYIDLPWIEEGDAYLEACDEQTHRDVSSVLFERSQSDGARILARYGDHSLIRELYRDADWTITPIESRNQGNNAVKEIWITNYEVQS